MDSGSDKTTLPAFPWKIVQIGQYTYLTDAHGNKLASIYGSFEKRKVICELIEDRINKTTSDHYP